MIRRCISIFIILFFLLQRSNAWHIIGGEMNYQCLGNNQYRLTLRIWRDCNSTTQFDDPVHLSIYNANHVLVDTIKISYPGSLNIPPDLSNPCIQLPPGICVQEAVYEKTITLQPSAGGYDISYQRCCRNQTVVNLINPQDQGATYTAHIPDPALAACNSNPYFNNYPPIVICVDQSFSFDHSATDPDGDQLVYSLCAPYVGADQTNPMPWASPPPYGTVVWASSYSVTNQIGGFPFMSINANTGLLTGHPTAIGQYVVGICVKEYRNGNLLDTHIRDFQFNVTTCTPLIVAGFSSQVSTVNDTMLICGSKTVDFVNQSYGTSNFHWDFGVPGINTDVSSASSPSYTYPDTGVYLVTLVASPGTTCGDSVIKYVEIRDGIQADFSFQSECALVPISFQDNSVPLDGIVSGWSWNFSDGNFSTLQNPIHAYDAGGTYHVSLIATNSYGCTDLVEKDVVVYPTPNIMAGPDTFICDIDSVTLEAHDGITYQWYPDYNLSSTTVADPLAKPDVTTTYYVNVTNNYGCTNTDSVLVMVTDTVIASTSNDTTICQGDPVQLWANNAVYYRWQPPDGLSASDISNPVAVPDFTTTYYVTSYIGSCFDEDTVTLTVLPRPIVDAGPDATINQGEQVQLEGSGDGQYAWQPPTDLSDATIADPIASPLNTIDYYLTVTGDNGCTALDSVRITVTHIHLLFIPNAFTPNGDGLNDYFQFFTKGIEQVLSVKIFNRWGNMMYSSSDNETPWDGTYKGEPSEMGTYAYFVRAQTYDGDVIEQKGNITLLR